MQFRQVFEQKQELQLRQTLTPQLIQMVGTFQSTYEALVDTIKTEAEDNVFITIKRDDTLLSSRTGKTSFKKPETGSGEYDPIANISHQDSLQEHLETQVKLEALKPKDQEIALRLIEAIDNRGYIPKYDEVRSQITSELNIANRKVDEILKIIHTLEPEGVGARTLKECLLIQVTEHAIESERLRELLEVLIKNHLDDLGDQKFEKLANKLKIEEESVAHLAAYIKENFNPIPGSEFSSSGPSIHITPSFEVEFEEGALKITNLEKEQGIDISLSEDMLKQLEDPNLDAKAKEFLKKQYQKAKELVENVHKRQKTLQNVAKIVLNRQKKFIKNGNAYLKPLLQKTIAEELGLSQSMVSRIVSSKYVETPYGVYSLKALCPRDHFGNTAERLKKIIADLIDGDPTFTDEEIRLILRNQGMNLARRTVTKYRLAADLPPKHKRLQDLQDK